MSATAIDSRSVGRFAGFSMIGVAAFFVPFTIGTETTIVIDHIVTHIVTRTPLIGAVCAALLIVWGVLQPFVKGAWKRSRATICLSVVKVLAIPLFIMYFVKAGPSAVMAPDVLPFLFERLAVPVGLVIPIGAFFLTFLMDFGLLELVGSFMERIMRPIFKTPGRSAIDALASFTGSYSVGMLITSRVYRKGLYSAKEAAIIVTGFSTVSATFMLIVAKTLSLSEMWLAYFFGTLLVTFSVTAITVRVPPLSTMNTYKQAAENGIGNRVSLISSALHAALEVCNPSREVVPLLRRNVTNGLMLASQVVPSILAMGFLGLMVAKYTPVFDVLGFVLMPVVWPFNPDSAHEISSVLASGLAEMFLPTLQSGAFDTTTRFVIGVVSVSSILFFSGSIPCIVAAGIPITLGQMVVIWLLRTLFSIPLAYVVSWLLRIS